MSRDVPLHPDLREKWGGLQFVQYQGNNEWSAECPWCGDYGHVGRDWPDRFRMFGPEPGSNSRGWCRQCRNFEWADTGRTGTPSPEAIEAARKERERLARIEQQRIQVKINRIEEAAYWRGFHDAMNDHQRLLWRQQGIPDTLIDYYKLGYTEHHSYYHAGQEFVSPAMTIPHFAPGRELSNVQYRLTQPAAGAGKYRQTAGLPASMFLTWPEQKPSGACLLLEGAKKAMVLYGTAMFDDLNIVAVPSKTPSLSMLEMLEDCDPVYIGLDPDAYEPVRHRKGVTPPAVTRIGDGLGGERVRYVHFPAKPDDLIVEYGLNGADLLKYIKRATVTA